jgi:signal transduction histidine kinase/PAS domain-containing protein
MILRHAGGQLRGVVRTNLSGQLVDASDILLNEPKWLQQGDPRDGESQWEYLTGPDFAVPDAAHLAALRIPWAVAFPLRAGGRLQGLFVYDPGSKPLPFDRVTLERVLPYCSLLSSILERFRAESQTSQRAEKLQELLEASAAAHLSIDVEGGIQYCNAAFVRLVHAEGMASALQLRMPEVMGPEAFQRLVGCIRQFKSVSNFECELTACNGHPVTVLMNLTAGLDASGHVDSLHGQLIDISDRRELEHALSELETGFGVAGGASFFQHLARHLTGAAGVHSAWISVHEPDGQGGRRGRVMAHVGCMDLPSEHLEDLQSDPIGQVLREGYAFEAHLTLEEGSLLPPRGSEAFMGMALYDLNGDSIGHICIASRHELNQEVRLRSILGIFGSRAASEIQRQSAEATLERTRAELAQTQKMEAVGRLAGGVAHDFNNILTSILGLSELMVSELPTDSPLVEDLGQIREAASRAAALTRQLLAFSRRQVLTLSVLDLNRIIGDMRQMCARLLTDRVDFQLTLSDSPLPIRCDRTQIEQVILNLAVNARDAMPNGGILTLTTELAPIGPHSDGVGALTYGNYAVLMMRDTGTGMDRETKARLFEPFYTTKPKGQGTGLGLATAYGIVSQSGGAITVESELGAGACFRVYLPLSDQAPQLMTPTTNEHPDLRGRENILVVDDDEMVRRLVRVILQRHGYHVVEARNSGEALLMAERLQIEIPLLVSDVQMAHMSGLELYDRIQPMRPRMAALFISGSEGGVSSSDERMRWLSKPFTSRQLLLAIRELLDMPFDCFDQKTVSP